MPADFKYYDAFGVERTIKNVLEPVELTDVEVTSGSNVITVAEASVVYPGQAICCPYVPMGSFVYSVRKSTGNPTSLELWRSTFNRTTGVWTTSGTNAQATDNLTGTTATVYGFSPMTIVELAYAMGMWRNIHTRNTPGLQPAGVSATLGDGASEVMQHGYGPGVGLVPTAVTTAASGAALPSTWAVRVCDTMSETPLKRHNGELHGAYILVSQYGYHSVVQALPGRELIYSPAA